MEIHHQSAVQSANSHPENLDHLDHLAEESLDYLDYFEEESLDYLDHLEEDFQ